MIQIFFSATQYAPATVTAAIRAGLFGPRENHRRILVVSNTAARIGGCSSRSVSPAPRSAT